MVKNVPCPRCGMPLELEELVCPHCRAPRDDMEIEEGRALVRKHEQRLKRRPKLVAAGLAAATLLAGLWSARGFMTSRLSATWREFQEEVEKTRQPSHWIKAEVPEALVAVKPVAPHRIHTVSIAPSDSPVAPPPARPRPAPPAPPPAREESASPAATPQDVPAAAPAPVPEAPPHHTMRFWYGVVYDLATLKPVAGAKLAFLGKRGDINFTTTDPAGHYRILLRKGSDSGRASVSVAELPGYRAGLLEDRDPPLRERPLDARRLIMGETTDAELEPVPLRCREDDESVALDLVLVPSMKK